MNLQKTAKISTSAAVAGLGFTALGLALSGGFGPCGPQKPGPFFVAIFGVLACATGMLGLGVCSVVLLSRKLKDFAQSHNA